MRFLSAVLALGLVLCTSSPIQIADAGPTKSLLSIQRFSGKAISGKYIVKFKRRSRRKEWSQRLKAMSFAEWDDFNEIAADLDDDTLNTLRASDDVEYIAEDGVMHIMATVDQTDAPWGLGRVASEAKLANQNVSSQDFTFRYDDSAGEGVDIYIVDTGVQVSHSEFDGRARWGASFVGEEADGHGHGTHCAGTAAGGKYGVAKKANVIAVQVLGADGSGSTSGIVSGLSWIMGQARLSGRPSVVSMSLGGGAALSLDKAVASLTASGIHVVVAAGNSNEDAANTSPARARSAITVAASTINDTKAPYSNFGTVVDIWAPGSNVLSSWIGAGDQSTQSISGTSMATPHVAGVVAYLIARDRNVTPSTMARKLRNLAHKNVLTGVPLGTVNELLHMD